MLKVVNITKYDSFKNNNEISRNILQVNFETVSKAKHS